MAMNATALVLGKVKSGMTFPTRLFQKSSGAFRFVGFSKGQLKLHRRVWVQFSP
jgi:hypothetical protein